MKKLLFIIFVSIFALASCQKEDLSCWSFSVQTYYKTATSTKGMGNATYTQCGLTESEAEMVRRGLESTHYIDGGITVVITASKNKQ
jgi:hypothetical protein